MSDLPRGFAAPAYLMIDEMIEYNRGEFEAICESPIEVAFATAFCVSGFIYHGQVATLYPGTTVPDGLADELKTLLEPQAKLGTYRVDFLVSPLPLQEGLSVVVECDGHNFHERTKEQAERDRSRDRALQSLGMKVFRFTGAEIYRDAFKCAEEVHQELWRMNLARPASK